MRSVTFPLVTAELRLVAGERSGCISNCFAGMTVRGAYRHPQPKIPG